MKIKIALAVATAMAATMAQSFEAAGKSGTELETAVNDAITKGYEVHDDADPAKPVEFKFKAAPPAPQPQGAVDLATIETKVKSLLDAHLQTIETKIKSHRPDVEVIDQIPHSKMYGHPRNITKSLVGDDHLRVAYRFGQWCLAAMGHTKAQDFCRKNNLQHIKVHTENANNYGGVLVPEEFDSMIIVLREQYGVFRREAAIVPMNSETKRIPRRTGGLVAYPVGETAAATESTKGWDQITLTAKDWVVLSRYTGQLDDDAVINVGDDMAGECAYAFTKAEDEAGFTGDGTSTYAGIVGFTNKLKNLSGTIGNIAGLVVATGTGYATNWDSITLADFNKVVGRLPQYAFVRGRCKWYCSQAFWGSVMQKLATAGGGNKVENIINGALVPMFLGFPVVISQALPTAAAINQVACLFGDIGLSAKMGTRRDTSIEFSREASIGGQSLWERNEIGIRAIERFDINIHDVGNASATASARVAGPTVGLITAAS